MTLAATYFQYFLVSNSQIFTDPERKFERWRKHRKKKKKTRRKRYVQLYGVRQSNSRNWLYESKIFLPAHYVSILESEKLIYNFQLIHWQWLDSDCYAAVKGSTELLKGKTEGFNIQ
jgi:hypothetical protein